MGASLFARIQQRTRLLRRAKGQGSSAPYVVIAGISSILILLLLTMLTTYAVLEVKTGLRAYVTGESLWSKGRQDVVFYLDRYMETGRPEDLERAKEGIAVPIGDLNARQALQASPPDPSKARRGFLQGGNHPNDVPRLIWLFQNFSHVSHMRNAVTIWQETDPYILRLQEITNLLEHGAITPEQIDEFQSELNTLNARLHELETDFLESLGAADRWLNRMVFISVVATLALAGILTMCLVWWAARRLERSERQLRNTLEHAGVGMARIGQNGLIQSANTRLCDTFSLTGDDLIGAPLSTLMEYPVSLPQIRDELEGGRREVTMDSAWNGPDSRQLCLRYTFSTMNSHGKRPADLILVVEDVSEEQTRVAELTYEATHDALTGLINRRDFKRRLNMVLDACQTEHSRHVLCFVDLDYFKEVNDSCGHAAGDQCLIQLCQILRMQLREGDVLARLGGDEFALILNYCPLNAAQRIAEQIRRNVAAFEFHWNNDTFQLSASIGLVELSSLQMNASAILHSADKACYEAKRAGRNQVYVMDPEELEKALEAGNPGTE
ncbi:PAS domain S-box-containing protein/diguanylate cyclase (GGDEF)-like protein [Halospina denitrificans]|uniref:PAS domain S-box-containing protein/diguanylate cyclase (GGDEF)-like protein n=1 Tax=Halospina denitrificans TaxID=332522 RepID=A0A4R7JXC5_9GAMM|nr:sensor domain-containing diguanylate cyclase [Halospina denitrificans]TDT43112.1 PAS domain S-box-containing protein/diguanylate cyclase (GGDEF)-like protein [Halospina denitrificans]